MIRSALIALLISASSMTSAPAQGDKAVVVGTITDTTGAVILGAEVSMTRASTTRSIPR